MQLSYFSSRQFTLPLILGLAHGLADCSSGWIIGTLSLEMGTSGIASLILLYNVLAFAGQLPLGALAEKFENPKYLVIGSLGLIAIALFLFKVNPILGIILAGLGSGLFHVAGGMTVLNLNPGKAESPGVFAAPGVIGLAIGGGFAINGFSILWFLFPALIAIAVLIMLFRFPISQILEKYISQAHLDTHDVIMIVLLFAIALRSALWNVFQLIHTADYMILLWIGLAAAIGKFFGGFIADRIGWKYYAVGGLMLASILLSFASHSLAFLLPGIALLQSTTPIAISAMHQLMPRHAGVAAGLSLGFGLALGGIPFLSGLSPGNDLQFWTIGIALFTALLYYLVLRKIPKWKTQPT